MEIRGLRETDDRAAVSRIYEESWRFAYQGIVPQAYLESIPAGRWAAHLDEADRHTLLLVEEGRFIGTASFGPSRFIQWPEAGEIISLYLLPEAMGQGHGRALLAAVIAQLATLGYQELFLWVLEDNHRARRFYEKAGFIPTEHVHEDAIGGKWLREIRYRYDVQ